MKEIKFKSIILLIPYLVLLGLGLWLRLHTSNMAFLDGDSDTYLSPPYLKAITGSWHIDERPFPYLEFVYLLISKTCGLERVVLVQKLLAVSGAVFLTAAWLLFISRLKGSRILYHLLGYLMLATYLGAPVLMYFEQQIGPESVCAFIMCVFIFTLTLGFSRNKSFAGFLGLSAAVFINLFLMHPMPKFIFIAAAVEVILVWSILRFQGQSVRNKVWGILLPHIIYVLFVFIPEHNHKPERPFYSRTYIEFQQMTFTHFDLLIADKSDFDLPAGLQDSLVQYFRESKKGYEHTLDGFSNDYLMFGNASNAIDSFYHYNYDSIGKFYRGLVVKLVTKYPVALSGEIGKQVYSFYIPNKTIHKEMYDYWMEDENMRAEAAHFDEHLNSSLHFINGSKADPAWLLSPRYPRSPAKFARPGSEYPGLFPGNNFFVYRWFDWLFIMAMVLFMAARRQQRKIFAPNTLSLFYLIIFIYVITISIVHTFDVLRFTTTIYPFLWISTFMSAAYILDWATALLDKADPA